MKTNRDPRCRWLRLTDRQTDDIGTRLELSPQAGTWPPFPVSQADAIRAPNSLRPARRCSPAAVSEADPAAATMLIFFVTPVGVRSGHENVFLVRESAVAESARVRGWRNAGRIAVAVMGREMREAGTESWRFAHDIDESLHCVLYLRDALGFQIEDDGFIPPRLAGEVPDRAQVLGPASAVAAAARWPLWWGAVVNQVAPAQLGPPSQQGRSQSWVREIAAWRGPVFDPPEWVSLEGSPALRDAARTLLIESCRWFGPAREPYLPPFCLDVFAWEQVRHAAERAALEHEVSPGKVNGGAQVLLVEGSWWHIVAPGVALCSIAAARDPAIAPGILKEAFDSYLAG